MAISKRWAIQEVFDMRIKEVGTDKLLAVVNDIKDAGLECGQENVYASGGKGNANIASFSHTKSLSGTMNAATYYNDVLELITGTDAVTGATTYPWSEVATVTTNASATTYTAVGTADAEIISLYEIGTDGSLGQEYTQVAGAPATGEFSYDDGTKVLTFFASDLADGSTIIVDYNFNAGASTHTITSNTNAFSKIVKLELVTLVQDVCESATEYASVIVVPKAKLEGNLMFDLAADGEVAQMNLDFTGLKESCLSNKLWELLITDLSEAS